MCRCSSCGIGGSVGQSDEREDEPEQGDMEAEDEELELGSVLSLLQMSCGTRNGDPLESPLRHLEVDSSVCI
jgi:hypothetical protein